MPTTVYCYDPENDPEGAYRREYEIAVSLPPNRLAAEMFAEDTWDGDEDRVARVRTHREDHDDYEDFLVHVEMVARFVAGKEE